jgi:predicted permease
MQQALLVGRQVLLIFIYIGVGITGSKIGIFNEKAGLSLSNFCLTFVTPTLIIRGFMRPIDVEEAKGIGVSILLALLFHVFVTLAVMPLIRKREDERYRTERLAVIFSNCGYMAIPLIRVACGERGAFFARGYISVFNICLWSLGVLVMTGERKMRVKQILFSPGIIGFTIGLILYVTQLPVPSILVEALDGLSGFNTPLSMITIGIFLVGIRPKETFLSPRIYWATFLRLVVFPLAMLTMLKVLGVAGWLSYGQDIVLTIGLGCACPSAAAVTLLPARFGRGGEYGAQIIAVSTLLSILTLPLVTLVISTWF